MPLTPKYIKILKEPFGTLITDEYVTKRRIQDFLVNSSPIVSIGDATTDRMVSFNFTPDISILDGREQRRLATHKYSPNLKAYLRNGAVEEFRCSNPAGTISQEAITILKKSLSCAFPVRIIVQGEEDMLALPVFVFAPTGALVLYGQPKKGLVIVKITPTVQRKAKDLMDRMKLL